MDDDSNHPELLSLTAKIVASHAGSNKLAVSELPALIARVFEALRTAGAVAVEQPVEALVPAVPIRKSVTPEFIVCLEDGKKLKMLKRHLADALSISDAGRISTALGLPEDYPMVAPGYAAQRSLLAKTSGLGRRPVDAEPEPEPEPGSPEARPPGGGGRSCRSRRPDQRAGFIRLWQPPTGGGPAMSGSAQCLPWAEPPSSASAEPFLSTMTSIGTSPARSNTSVIGNARALEQPPAQIDQHQMQPARRQLGLAARRHHDGLPARACARRRRQ